MKDMIYRQFGYSESEYNIIIYVRCNFGTRAIRYYELVELVCNEGWTIIFQQLMNSGREFQVIDFYIEFVPIVGVGELQLCSNFEIHIMQTIIVNLYIIFRKSVNEDFSSTFAF